MIVKILKSTFGFPGVSYNTNKIERNKGELMKVRNFGPLQAIDQLRPQDYVNYLEAVSAINSRVKYPQFHAVISAKGKESSKEELTALAEKWLEKMGYGDNPYLLIFHKDTGNNHVHMVSTRVDKLGKKISDSYEKIRAYQALHQVMGKDEVQVAADDIAAAMSYQFSTRAQFKMLLEVKGYRLSLNEGHYHISKFGKVLGQASVADVDSRIRDYLKDSSRLDQLRAIIKKYRSNADPAVYFNARAGSEKASRYSSALADLLSEKFGVHVLFHSSGGKPVYGYTVIDHAQKAVYKGSDLMALAEFIKSASPGDRTNPDHAPPSGALRDNYSELSLSEEIADLGDSSRAIDPEGKALSEEFELTTSPEISLDISNDIDDEAIHGPSRRRKRKARTNSR